MTRIDPIEFIAVLVFEEGPERRSIEEHVFRANHPEIAYQCALAKGGEERYGRQFVGLAELCVKSEEVAPFCVIQSGSASEIVCPKGNLSAFNDSRWVDVSPDEAELEAALREPPMLVDLDGLDAVEWGELTHAYGSARDVPLDLRRLASSVPAVRDAALWELQGSIYHQSDVYDATAAAVPFLIRLASCSAPPNRCDILDLVAEIARSAFWDPDKIRKAWAKARARYSATWGDTGMDIAEQRIANMQLVQPALIACSDQLRALLADANERIRTSAKLILQETAKRPDADHHEAETIS